MSSAEFGYPFVGARSVGCVVAARLSESGGIACSGSKRALPTRLPWIHVPIGCAKTIAGEGVAPVIMVAEKAADLVREDEPA